MTALTMDVRELSVDEISDVAGGPVWLVPLAVGLLKVTAVAAGVAIVGEFAIGVVNGIAEELKD